VTIQYDGTLSRWLVLGVINLDAYAPLASPVFTGDPQAPTPATSDNDTSIATTAYVQNNKPAAETNANDIFRVDAAGASGWTGTINGAPSGSTVTYTNVSGNKNTLVPSSTSQLGKQILYNTTRGTSALISTSNGTTTITLTATVPAGWASGDTITTLSPTVGAAGWVDIKIASGPTGKSALFILQAISDSGAAGIAGSTQEFGADVSSHRSPLVTQTAAAANLIIAMFLKKINSDIISCSWGASGAATTIFFIREMGYIP
jgi:hypothetical protein